MIELLYVSLVGLSSTLAKYDYCYDAVGEGVRNRCRKRRRMERLKMETEKLREFFKEWAKENGLILIRLSSGQYNSPKTEAAWKAFQAATKLAHGKSN